MITLSDAISQARQVLEQVETIREWHVESGPRWWFLTEARDKLRGAIEAMDLADMQEASPPKIEFSEGAGHD